MPVNWLKAGLPKFNPMNSPAPWRQITGIPFLELSLLATYLISNMKDLTIYSVINDAIRDLTTAALAGNHVDLEQLTKALDTILYGATGLPAAASAGGALMANLDSQIEMLRSAEQRIQGRRAHLQGVREAAEAWTLRRMQEQGIRLIEDQAGAFTLVRRRNPPKVEILNDGEIPQLYRKIQLVETLDKLAIADALKNNDEVPGARLVQTERLEIR